MIHSASPRPRGLLLGALAALAVFVLMAAHLRLSPVPITQPLDDAWRGAVGADSPVGGPVFWFFEQFGYGVGYATLAAVGVLLLATGRLWTLAFVLLSALAGPGLISQGTKNLIDRPRPAGDPTLGLYGPWVAVDHGSFPSGHALTMGFAVVAIGILLPVAHRRWWSWVAVVLCLGMVWQRTLANAHWLSDTLFGALAGAAVTIVVWYLLYLPVTAERALPWRWGWRADGLRQRPGSASGDLTS